MKELSNRIESINESPLTKWDTVVKDAKAREKTIIALNAGQPDFVPPFVFNEAIVAKTEDVGINYYTSPEGNKGAREAISLFQESVFNLKYDQDEIIIMNGAKEGIFASLGALINEGDEVIVIAPYWSTYIEVIKLWGGMPVIVNSDNNFHLDIKSIQKAITAKTKAIVINSPNNPTGVIYSEEELQQLAELAIQNDLYVISDEIYANITYEKRHFSIASIKGMKKRTVVVNGFSKSFSVTGYRIGYVAASKVIINAMLKIKSNSSGNTNSLFQAVTTEVILNKRSGIEKFFRQINLIFRQRKNLLCKGLSKLGIEYYIPDGAFYVFAKIPRSFQMSSLQFSEYLLKNAKIAVSPGIFFGENYDDYVRIAFSSSKEELSESLERIKKILNDRGMV